MKHFRIFTLLIFAMPLMTMVENKDNVPIIGLDSTRLKTLFQIL